MEIRLSQLVAAVAVLGIGLVLWVASSSDGEPSRPSGVSPSAGPLYAIDDTSVFAGRAQGSAVPCAFPLEWRVARVDPRFELSRGEVVEVVREAAAVWEDATGRDLFTHGPEEGFPIRLVFDERQAESRERRAGEAALRESTAGFEATREELAELERRYEEAAARFRESAEDLQERLEAYNDTVRTWNARGGAPEDVASRLRAMEEALRREELELQARQGELDRQRLEIEEAFRDLRSEARAVERRATDLEESFPATAVQAGMYREAVTSRGDEVVSVRREIRVYRFEDRSDLRRVLAHELGHAMGLGHIDASGALMNERYARLDAPEAPVAVGAPDLDLLRERCPGF